MKILKLDLNPSLSIIYAVKRKQEDDSHIIHIPALFTQPNRGLPGDKVFGLY